MPAFIGVSGITGRFGIPPSTGSIETVQDRSTPWCEASSAHRLGRIGRHPRGVRRAPCSWLTSQARIGRHPSGVRRVPRPPPTHPSERLLSFRSFHKRFSRSDTLRQSTSSASWLGLHQLASHPATTGQLHATAHVPASHARFLAALIVLWPVDIATQTR